MKNQVTVNIYGRSYPMITEESPEYTERIAGILNDRFAKLREQKKSLSIQDAAAIISLECIDELVKNKQTEQNIRTQISAYAEDANTSRAEVDKLNKEIEKLRERVRQLESEVKLRASFEEDNSAERIVHGRNFGGNNTPNRK
ncbi:MAG: cell division protein ZapA [Ruminococcus sp.]|nr:cell division protein ZapA [Ruminococcus sp.]